jgi:hypothetical protein
MYNPLQGVPYINGEMYSWGQVIVKIAGVPVTGITAISYKESQEVTPQQGAGRYAVGYKRGRISVEASITLHKDEVVALEDAAPFGRLQDYAPFDIEVHFAHPTTSKIRTDILKQCLFSENGDSWSEDNNGDTIELPLICPYIEKGNKL